jgi:hypothetical protein
MAARNFLSNFENLFGDSHLYKYCDVLVVVALNLELICKFSKFGVIFFSLSGSLFALLFWST